MKISILISLAFATIAIASCTALPTSTSTPSPLIFDAHVAVSTKDYAVASAEVRNVESMTIPVTQTLNGVMQIRDERGGLRAHIEVPSLNEPLAPGQTAILTGWKGKLPPGTFVLIWGAPTLGCVEIQFDIVNQEGKLYLTTRMRQQHPGGVIGILPEWGDYGSATRLVELAKADLQNRLGVRQGQVLARNIEAVEFLDSSLGVHDQGQVYPREVTPGYIVNLSVSNKMYEYHGSDSRVIHVSNQLPASDRDGRVVVESVQVVAGQSVTVRGRSKLPTGICLQTQLYGDGALVNWWPARNCVQIDNGVWRITVPLGVGDAPEQLNRKIKYSVRARLQDQSPIESQVFAFDLASPPGP